MRGLISRNIVSALDPGTSHKAIIQLLDEELWFLFLDLSTGGRNDYGIMKVQKFASWLVADEVLMYPFDRQRNRKLYNFDSGLLADFIKEMAGQSYL